MIEHAASVRDDPATFRPVSAILRGPAGTCRDHRQGASLSWPVVAEAEVDQHARARASDAELVAAARDALDGGRPAEALDLLDQLSAPQLDHRRLRAGALDRLGRLREALEECESLMAASGAVGDDLLLLEVTVTAAGLAQRLGDRVQAIHHVRLALELLVQRGDSDAGMYRVYNNLGFALLSMGAARLAVEQFRRALRAVSEVDDPHNRVTIELNLASAESRLAASVDADDNERPARFQTAIDLVRPHFTSGSPRRRLEAATLLADALVGVGRIDEAVDVLAEVRGDVDEVSDPRALCEHAITEARVARLTDQIELAERAADRAVGSATRTRDNGLLGAAFHERSLARNALGMLADAFDDLHMAYSVARERRAGLGEALLRQLEQQAVLRVAHRDSEQRAHSMAVTIDRLRTAAATDHLTGLPNRRALDEFRQGAPVPVAVAMFDLDHFKSVNDTYGHLVGDIVLQRIARILDAAAGERGTVYRWGGEEFLLVCPGADADVVLATAEHARQLTATADWAAVAPDLRMTLSAGAAEGSSDELDELVERADLALYRAKQTGRDRVEVG